MQSHSSQIPRRQQPAQNTFSKPSTTKAGYNSNEKVKIPKISDFKIQPLFKKNFEPIDEISHGQRVTKYLQLYGEIESKREQLMGKDNSPRGNTKDTSVFTFAQKNGAQKQKQQQQQQQQLQASTSQQKRSKVVHKAIRTQPEQSRVSAAAKSPDPLQEQVEVKQQTDQLIRRLEQLTYVINKARSDKLELERDLATYEYYFCQHYQLRPKLAVLKAQTHQLSQLSESIDDQMANQYKLQTYINQKMECLNQNELIFQKQMAQIDKEIEVKLEDESNILLNPDYNLQHNPVHQQILKISNVYVIASVHADKMLNNFIVSMQNQRTGEIYKYDLAYSINEQDARENPQVRAFEIQNKLLKYFYFTAEDDRLKIDFMTDYGKE